MDLASQESFRNFVRDFLQLSALVPCGPLTVTPEQEGWFNFVQLLENGCLSGSVAAAPRTVYLDLFVKGFTDPRKVAETAVKLLGGAYYRMQPQVRI